MARVARNGARSRRPPATASVPARDLTGTRMPTTARGAATRAALVKAARKVFERDGFIDARVADITATARTALGTFYQYFEDKEDVWIAVFKELSREGLHPPTLDYLAESAVDPVTSIQEHHRTYLEAFLRHVELMRVQDEVMHLSDTFRRIRRDEAQPYIDATCATIRSLQESGRADPAVNPLRMARTLSVAVSRSAFVTFVMEDEGAEAIDELVETLTTLWINALKIPCQVPQSTEAHREP